MLRRALPLLALLSAACGQGGDEAERTTPAAAPAPSEAAITPAAVAQRPPTPGQAPGKAQAASGLGADTYVGRWAVQPNLCAAGAWTFTADRLTTAGEVACDFRMVERTATGWKISARCTAEGPPKDATLNLTLTDPAPPETMTVSGGPFELATVRRCP